MPAHPDRPAPGRHPLSAFSKDFIDPLVERLNEGRVLPAFAARSFADDGGALCVEDEAEGQRLVDVALEWASAMDMRFGWPECAVVAPISVRMTAEDAGRSGLCRVLDDRSRPLLAATASQCLASQSYVAGRAPPSRRLATAIADQRGARSIAYWAAKKPTPASSSAKARHEKTSPSGPRLTATRSKSRQLRCSLRCPTSTRLCSSSSRGSAACEPRCRCARRTVWRRELQP